MTTHELQPAALADLPAPTREVLTNFLNTTNQTLGSDLVAAVLFGSSAEGRLRATSDVNLVLVLRAFDSVRMATLRPGLRVAEAAIRLQCMFLLETEMEDAARVFPVKFADILRRHRVVVGRDPFAGLTIPRPAAIFQLRQSLLNQLLRMREAWVSRGMREEQLWLTLADAAGPLRSAAAELLDLEGTPAPSPREALSRVASGPTWTALLDRLSSARHRQLLAAGAASDDLLQLLVLTEQMRQRAEKLA